MLDVVLLRARGLDPGVKLFYTYASRLGFFTCLPCLALSSNVYSILLYLAPNFSWIYLCIFLSNHPQSDS